MKIFQILFFIVPIFFFNSAQAENKPMMGAERHAALGVTCQSCHGDDPMKNDLPTEQQCSSCHNTAALKEKTKDVSPLNPHAAPHNNDCTVCHRQHEPAVNYCDQCHYFNYRVK